MISNQSVEDFKAICGGIKAMTVDTVQRGCLMAIGEANARGLTRSSFAALQMDRIAVEAFNSSAEQLYGALKVLNDSEPTTNPRARRQQLLELLESQMRELGEVALIARVQYRNTCAQGILNSSLLDDRPSLAAIDLAIAQYGGHLGSAIMTLSNTTMRQFAPSVQIINHATTGAIVVGDGNAATVTQLLVTQVTPSEVKAALDALIQALQSAHSVSSDDREAVTRMLEQLKVEAGSEKPNKRTVSTLIAGSRDVVELLEAAPGAWDTVKSWYAFIAASAAQAAPVIGQALQNLGG